MNNINLLKICTLILLLLIINGCVSFTTANSNTWIKYEVPPSRINYSGKSIFEGQFSDGIKFSVYYDENIGSDGQYYYSILMQDFGWHWDGDGWAGYNPRRPERGKLYVNPNRQVAIYFYPQQDIDVFRINIESSR